MFRLNRIPKKLNTTRPLKLGWVNHRPCNIITTRSYCEIPKPKQGEDVEFSLPHPIWDSKQVNNVKIEHKQPTGLTEKLAYYSVETMRFGFDVFSGYYFGEMTEKKWLIRLIFLETVAGVPGMMGGMARHLTSLRKMIPDNGWIHTLLEEAENERMHLMVCLELKKPSFLFRWAVLLTQGIFTNFYFLLYLVSPHFCHKFVAYLEEEAVVTYTKLLDSIKSGKGEIGQWQTKPAPEIAIKYWKLPKDATMLQVIEEIRADEAHHRLVNHKLGELKPETDANPFPPGF
eukprot:TRINITY_DN2674_c0_g1_i1.p1 TRINITY_DN2674_c0_g1~~TRINITY_DN2674_c0_g1_i1.p1  ORF type:complete len:287 (-),score=56.82 TRINITY_DN2674_c0_g1_i1:197-1057(-)